MLGFLPLLSVSATILVIPKLLYKSYPSLFLRTHKPCPIVPLIPTHLCSTTSMAALPVTASYCFPFCVQHRAMTHPLSACSWSILRTATLAFAIGRPTIFVPAVVLLCAKNITTGAICLFGMKQAQGMIYPIRFFARLVRIYQTTCVMNFMPFGGISTDSSKGSSFLLCVKERCSHDAF